MATVSIPHISAEANCCLREFGHARTDSQEILHQTVDDVAHWMLFKKRKGNLFIVGSLSLDRYVIVPENKLGMTLQCVRYLDGSHELEWIHKRIAAEHERDADINELLLKLKAAGLVKTAQPPKRAHNELLRHSIHLFEMNVSGMFRHLSKMQKLFHAYSVVAGLILILFGLLNLTHVSALRITHAQNVGAQVEDYFIFWLGLVTVAFMHECFHGFAAIRYGLQPRRVNGALYLGFIPYIYISIPGIYTLSPKRRIVVWCAGVYANLLFGALLLLIFPHLSPGGLFQGTVARLIWANLLIIIVNLSPFMATDGYFVLSTLVKTPNIRTNAYLEFKKWIRRKEHNFNSVLACYFGLSISMIIWMLIGTIVWLKVTIEQWLETGWTSNVMLKVWPLAFMLICILIQGLWNRKLRTSAP